MGTHAFNAGTSKQQITHNKVAIPSIDRVSHMWLGFPIHEAMALHRGTKIIRETRTNKEFAKIGTPSRKIIDFRTLRRAFPHVP